jgi:uncharacterized protein YjbJ (UPF0337 family)
VAGQREAQSAITAVAPHFLVPTGRFPSFRQYGQYGKEAPMNWDRVEGDWKQLMGQVRQQSGSLTNDDLDVIEGKRTEFSGRLQKRYGIAKDEAERQNRCLAEYDSLAVGQRHRDFELARPVEPISRSLASCAARHCARRTAPG